MALLCPLQSHSQLLSKSPLGINLALTDAMKCILAILSPILQSVRPKPDGGHFFTPTLPIYMIDLLWDIICFCFMLRLCSQTKNSWKQILKNQILICCVDLKGRFVKYSLKEVLQCGNLHLYAKKLWARAEC